MYVFVRGICMRIWICVRVNVYVLHWLCLRVCMSCVYRLVVFAYSHARDLVCNRVWYESWRTCLWLHKKQKKTAWVSSRRNSIETAGTKDEATAKGKEQGKRKWAHRQTNREEEAARWWRQHHMQDTLICTHNERAWAPLIVCMHCVNAFAW